MGSMILYYCIQPIDGDTDIVNQANPYRSENYLHRAYRHILQSKQLRAKELKNGPCKQAVRSYWMYFMLPIIPYENDDKMTKAFVEHHKCDK